MTAGSGSDGDALVKDQGSFEDAEDPFEEEWHHGLAAPPWLLRLSLVLAVVGLADSVYLTIAHYTDPKVLACSDKGAINCAKVTTSAASKLAGIPVADLGTAFFVGLVLLCLPMAWRTSNLWVHRVRLAAVTGGIAFVVYLLYSELFTIGAICLYCTGVHVITFLLFILVLTWGPNWRALE